MVLGEIAYFFTVSFLGMKIEEDGKNENLEKNEGDIEKGNNSDNDDNGEDKGSKKDDTSIVKTPTKKKVKKPEKKSEEKPPPKRSFFLKKDDFVSRITKSLVKMSSLKTSKDPET